ncbi:MAG: ATP-dependent DNA helicase RecG [Parvibaculales bacterium]
MRPSTLDPFFADITHLPGIGQKSAQLLASFTGDKVVDLLHHLPNNLIDRSYRPAIGDIENDCVATFEVEILQHKPPPARRRNLPYRVLTGNETGYLTLVFFHAKADWLKRVLPVGSRRMVSGRVEKFREQVQIVHPDHMLTAENFAKLPVIEPVYPLTAGLSGKMLSKAIQAILPNIPPLPEWCGSIRTQKNWPDMQAALRQAHRPEDTDGLSLHHPARERLAYDELLAHQLALALARRNRKQSAGKPYQGTAKLTNQLTKILPFALTQAQQAAISEIQHDIAAPQRMLRLLQGDVGSGKTLVAVMAILQVIESGAQAALMVPTEILARQHAAVIGKWLDEIGVSWQLFTGKLKGKERSKALANLADGHTQLAIGTHALFQEDLDFHALGLAVVDEQHRFGVQQRIQLSRKGDGVDVLVMTATPIPRTLTLTLYGDMDVSYMVGKPPGRKPVDTRLINMLRYDEVADSLARAINNGARIYWVCPLINESDMMDLSAATNRFQALQKLYGDKVGLVHGQMKAAQKDAVMAQFQNGDIAILVATTVIEVGVDVPQASIMVIEHAERFGLAQLHQLRGRVGRGGEKSSCLLLYRAPLGETAQTRLAIMRESEDGFKIAEQDLELRGAGEVLGTRQSGLPEFRLVDWQAHAHFLPSIAKDIKQTLQQDPALQSPNGQALRTLLYLFRRDEAIHYLRSG